jgi:hypothetical protein
MTAIECWNDKIGKGVQDSIDYTGRLIKKAAFNQTGSRYGWMLEYIQPIEQGGTETADNLHIVSIKAHILREGKTTYSIDGVLYQTQNDECGNRVICKIGEKRSTVWEREFGDVNEAADFAGYKILKGGFGKEKSEYGWDIDHIQPLSKGGTDTLENRQIVRMQTNREKADKITFVIDGQQYQVRETSNASEDEWADYDYSHKKYCIVRID